MTVFEKMRGAQLLDYYPTMWMDGYEPGQIIEAAHKTMLKDTQPEPPADVNINVEVNKK